MFKFLKENFIFLALLECILFVGFRYDRYVIQTGSMEPALEVGSIVLVDPERTPKRGEIAAYQSGTNTVIHRVIKVEDGLYTMKGDHNGFEDPVALCIDDFKGTVILKWNWIAPLVRKLCHL